MAIKCVLVMLTFAGLAQCQRPSFAGSRPIGYPEITTSADELGNRFGEVDGTTQRLPLEALGDRDLVDRLSKLPIDKQPFWFINWQALEAQRKNPQTYPQKPNPFAEPLNINSGDVNVNSSPANPSNANTNSASVVSDSRISSNSETSEIGNEQTVNNKPNLSSAVASSNSENINSHSEKDNVGSGDLVNRNKFFNYGNASSISIAVDPANSELGNRFASDNSNSFAVDPANSGLGNTFGNDNSNSNSKDDSSAAWKQILYHQNPLKYKHYGSEVKKSGSK